MQNALSICTNIDTWRYHVIVLLGSDWEVILFYIRCGSAMLCGMHMYMLNVQCYCSPWIQCYCCYLYMAYIYVCGAHHMWLQNRCSINNESLEVSLTVLHSIFRINYKCYTSGMYVYIILCDLSVRVAVPMYMHTKINLHYWCTYKISSCVSHYIHAMTPRWVDHNVQCLLA